MSHDKREYLESTYDSVSENILEEEEFEETLKDEDKIPSDIIVKVLFKLKDFSKNNNTELFDNCTSLDFAHFMEKFVDQKLCYL